MYADDVQIYQHFSLAEAEETLKSLNNSLVKINEWSIRNGLNLNSKKCQHLIIGSRQFFNAHPVNACCHYNAINLNNMKLQTSNKARNVGLLFDQHLS
jgi:hypothetical protein